MRTGIKLRPCHIVRAQQYDTGTMDFIIEIKRMCNAGAAKQRNSAARARHVKCIVKGSPHPRSFDNGMESAVRKIFRPIRISLLCGRERVVRTQRARQRPPVRIEVKRNERTCARKTGKLQSGDAEEPHPENGNGFSQLNGKTSESPQTHCRHNDKCGVAVIDTLVLDLEKLRFMYFHI